ncbi:MAG: DUF4313 domain-containing protein [Eubacteriales bacterium]|nr:DUF4313 domain-containing protein [Eubacteriales bacterium]
MTERSFTYEWDHGPTEVKLNVSSYQRGNRLYIGMYRENEAGGSISSFEDLTANLEGYDLAEDEAFISSESTAEKMRFIRQHRLGCLAGSWNSGIEKYLLVKFNLKRLAMLDPDEVSAYLKSRREKNLI